MGLLLVNTITRYKATHFLPDLPEAFDGFTITQISDLHSGSFDNPEKLSMQLT
jgi:predicted MPP superfamily phosphohydrolase